MNSFDTVTAIMLGLGLIRGLYKGFFLEISSLVSMTLGAYVSINFSNYSYGFISVKTGWPEATVQIAAFIVTFIIVAAAVFFIARGLTKLLGIISLGVVNRVFGGLFGVAKTALFASLILLIANKAELTENIFQKEVLQTSFFYKPIESIASKTLPKLIEKTELNIPMKKGP